MVLYRRIEGAGLRMSMVCVFTLCILRPASFVKTAVHWSQLNAFSDLAVTEAKVGVITGTVVDAVGVERGGLTGRAGGDGSGSLTGGDVALPRVSW